MIDLRAARLVFIWLLAATGLATLACVPSSASGGAAETGAAPILLFAGNGTSPNDVAALERILRERGLAYATASSRQLDALSVPALRAYRLVIVPGGNFEEIGNGVGAGTTVRLRDAIGAGVNYLGVCAGAFFAGRSPYNGLDLTAGVRFPFYAAEHRGIRKAAVAISTPGAPTLDHYWEDGPHLAGWGEVVAKYPDGTPAVVQGRVGEGWVVLTGVHPEAPEAWRRGLGFTTPASASHVFAATLIDAAVNGRRLPHY